MLFEFIGGAVKLLGIGRGLPFDRDIRPDIRIVCIELKPFLQTGLRVGYDGFSRALRHAHAAIDAFIRMDGEHIIAFASTKAIKCSSSIRMNASIAACACRSARLKPS